MRAFMISRNLSSSTGSLAIVLALTGRLRALGWDIELCGEKIAPAVAAAANGRAHALPRWRWLRGYADSRAFAWRARRIAERGRYDLVIGHGDADRQDVLFLHNLLHLAREWIPGGEAKKLSRIGRFHERVLRAAEFRICIANSDLMARDLSARFGLASDRLRVARPGYDPRRFHALPGAEARRILRERLALPPATWWIGLVTSGDFRKRGLTLLLDAFAQLKPELRSRTRLLVVGRDRLAQYQARAQRLAIAERVHFRPPGVHVEDYYRALDVLVHPAHIEEFGLAVLEAMACGIPVLISRRVGAAELLEEAAGEMVMDRPVVEEIAARLERLLSDEGSRAACAEFSLRASAGQTWEAYLDRVCAVLAEGGWTAPSSRRDD